MSKLTFKLDRGNPISGYWAQGETYGYQLRKDGKVWLLQVREIVTTAGVRHTLGQEVLHCWTQRFHTLAEGKAVVQNFEDDPRHDMWNAIRKYQREVVEPRNAAIVAEYDRVFGSNR